VFLAIFHHCQTETKVKLFSDTFCISLYGCTLWNIIGRSIDRFYTTWRKAVIGGSSLYPRIHCVLLPLIIEAAPIEFTLLTKFVNFLKRASLSGNNYVRLTYLLVQNGSISSVSNSPSLMGNKLKFPRKVLCRAHASLIEKSCSY
jgi:hypothetical protein